MIKKLTLQEMISGLDGAAGRLIVASMSDASVREAKEMITAVSLSLGEVDILKFHEYGEEEGAGAIGTSGGSAPIIQFVSYTGKWPNLCSGVLTLDVDGERVQIKNCLNFTGRASFDKDYNASIENGPWEIDEDYLPGKLKPHTKTVERLVNDNVPHGCCGGCI